MIDRTQLCKNSAEENSHSLISQWQTRKEKAICKSREQSRPFAYPKTGEGPPQKFALLTNCAQERDYAVWNGREQEKRRRLASEGSSYHPF